MPISHVGIPVADSDRSWAFYTKALAPLGMQVTTIIGPDKTFSGGTAIGYGTEDAPDVFWIGGNEQAGEGVHIAFQAATCEEVENFHRAALAAGGTDNGEPGLRPHYGTNYYAAFVRDPDGHNIEVVCQPTA